MNIIHISYFKTDLTEFILGSLEGKLCLAGQLISAQEFDGFGCTGKNISPALSWKDAPKGTKSFAITMYDKDAPTGSGWWHWSLFNIPASESKIVTNASRSELLPKGTVEGKNDERSK